MDDGLVLDFESLYYPGEAALGLLSLYESDHSGTWLNAAENALAYLANSRVNLSNLPADHWALIATAKLLSYRGGTVSPTLRQALIRHAT